MIFFQLLIVLGFKSFYAEKKTEAPTVIQPTEVDISELSSLLPQGLDIGMKFYKGHQDYDTQASYCDQDKVQLVIVSVQASGAYVFRPLDNTPVDYAIKKVETVQTDIYTEVRVTYEESGSFIVRTFAKKPEELEVEWQVGPIDGRVHFPGLVRITHAHKLF